MTKFREPVGGAAIYIFFLIHEHGPHLIDIFLLRNQLGNVKAVGRTASAWPNLAGSKRHGLLES